MPKLNLDTAVRRLREADEMRAVAVAKVKQPDSEPGVVKVKKPSLKLTRIDQITGPKKTMPKENPSGGLQIPTAEFGGDIVDSTPKMTFKNSKKGTQGGLKAPSVKTVKKPSDTMREIGDPIKRTEEGGGFGQGVEFLDGSPSANQIEAGMPKGMKSGGNSTPTVGKITPKQIGPESPQSGKVTIKQPTENKTIPQIKKPEGFQSEPSDAGDRKTSFPTVESVRSGVEVRLGNKTKARFGLVNEAVLTRMVEAYRGHGYELKVVSTGEAAWKKDRKLLQTIWESIDAEFNFVPEAQRDLRKAALNRLSQISQNDFNSLYESRHEFVGTLVKGFEQIEKAVRRRYTESMQLMVGCTARFVVNGTTVDAEITTEAHNPQMALRQIRNILQEQYGLSTKIVHIFVDAVKYTADQIEPWSASV